MSRDTANGVVFSEMDDEAGDTSRFRPESPEDHYDSEPVSAPFATKDTYVAASAYLNQSLNMFNYPGPIDFERMAVEDRVTAVNALYQLLRDRQATADNREELTSRLHLMADDNRVLTDKNATLLNDIRELERANYDLDVKKRNLESELRKQEARLKGDITALQKKNTMLQSRDNQYKHELRKREKEFSTLQERLQRLLSDKGRESKVGMDILNNLKATGQAGGKWKNATKPEEELFRQTVNAYEERMNELIAENTQLRASLGSLSKELQDSLNSHGVMHVRDTDHGPEAQFAEPLSPATKEALEDFNPAQLNMPFDMVRSNVEGGLRARMRLLRDKISSLHSRELNDESSDTIEKLKGKIEQQRLIITEQDQLIRSSLEEPPDSSQQDLIDQSRRWSMMEELENQKSLLKKHQDSSTSAAMDLDRQRRELDAARRKFEEEKLQWLQRVSPADNSRTPSSMGTPDLSSPAPFSASSASSSASSTGAAAAPSSKKLSFDSPSRPVSLAARPRLVSASDLPTQLIPPSAHTAVPHVLSSASSRSLSASAKKSKASPTPSDEATVPDMDPRLVSPMRKIEIEVNGAVSTTVPSSPLELAPAGGRRS